uniref:Uncharacterized protein n=1 Tax=Timema poppense TaxID=170557 RepID=A0A7R9DN30_TIMPO|nr:unnamed protein product [Timema poppensis]
MCGLATAQNPALCPAGEYCLSLVPPSPRSGVEPGGH